MQIPKEQILELLRSRGQNDQAQQADAELPQQVDPQQHAGLLGRFGLDPQALIAALAGGGGIGGLLGGLTGGGQQPQGGQAQGGQPQGGQPQGGQEEQGGQEGQGGLGGALGGLLGR